jgi:hypothetical protein
MMADIILFTLTEAETVQPPKIKYKISRLRPGIRRSTRSRPRISMRGVTIHNGNDLYCLKPTASARIPLHIYDGQSSDKRTGRSAHTTTTTTTRQLLLGWVITLRSGGSRLFHCRRDRVTARTRTLGNGMSPRLRLLSLLLPVCCIRIWRGRSTCDHVWGEDVVERYATVV